MQAAFFVSSEGEGQKAVCVEKWDTLIKIREKIKKERKGIGFEKRDYQYETPLKKEIMCVCKSFFKKDQITYCSPPKR